MKEDDLIQGLKDATEGELGPEWQAFEMIARYMKATNIALGDLSDAITRLSDDIQNLPINTLGGCDHDLG